MIFTSKLMKRSFALQTAFSALVCAGLLFVFYAVQTSAIMTALGSALTLKWITLLLASFLWFIFGVMTVCTVLLFCLPPMPKRAVWLRTAYLFICSGLMIYVVFDTKLFIITGNHFYDQFVWQSLQNSEVNKELHLGIASLLSGIGLIVFLFVLPHLVHWLLHKRLKICKFSQALLLFPLAGMLGGGLLFVFANKTEQIKPAFLWPHNASIDLHSKGSSQSYIEYKQEAAQPNALLQHRTNVVFITIESFRADMIPLMPHLQALQQKYGSYSSLRHYCGVNVTQKSIFTLLYGLLGSRYELFCKDSVPSVPLGVLKHNQYVLQGFSASGLANWNGAGFITKQFDHYTELTDSLPYYNDSVLVEQLRHSYTHRDSSKAYFYFAFLNSTHHNYFFPPQFEKYKPVMPQDYNHFLGDDSLLVYRDKILNRYKNSILYVDYLIGKLETIFANDLQNNDLILVITGDHGEEFWDKGLLGHGASNLYNCRTQVPLFIHLPHHAPADTISCSSHVQIMPTILQQLGINETTNRYCDAPSLLQNKASYAVIAASDFDNNGSLCLVTPWQKYWMTVGKDSIAIKRTFTLNDLDTAIIRNPLLESLQKKIFQQVWKY